MIDFKSNQILGEQILDVLADSKIADSVATLIDIAIYGLRHMNLTDDDIRVVINGLTDSYITGKTTIISEAGYDKECSNKFN